MLLIIFLELIWCVVVLGLISLVWPSTKTQSPQAKKALVRLNARPAK